MKFDSDRYSVCYNRTYVELKLFEKNLLKDGFHRYNRTYVELKHTEVAPFHPGNVVIIALM